MPRPSGDDDYQRRLGEVLHARDLIALRAFLEAGAKRYGDARQVAEIVTKSDRELEMLLHRMILSRQDLVSLHTESRRWLVDHGHESQGPDRPHPG